jgi:hypothetical protein
MSLKMVKATLIKLDTGEEIPLKPNEINRCFIMDWFEYEGYDIQLRLDNNKSLSANPVLDADAFLHEEPINGKWKHTGKQIYGKFHHTDKKYDPVSKEWTYTFELDLVKLGLAKIGTPLTLKFIATITYQLTLTSNAMIVTDKCTPTLVRGDDNSNP